MIRRQIKGFTLVELIVVIVILAILATIAFMTFSSQSSVTRDSKRVTELRELSSAIEKELVTSSRVAIPTNPIDMKFNGCVAFRQGTFGKDTLTSVGKISEIPKDPLYGNEFTYSISQNKTEYEIAGVLENDQTAYVNPFIDNAYAGSLAASPGVCGSADGTSLPDTTIWTDLNDAGGLCSVGSSPIFNGLPKDFVGSDGIFNWTCGGNAGGADTSCSATNSSYTGPSPSVGVKKTGRAVVIGNYNLIMTKTECPNGDNVLLGLPSIISANTTDNLDTQFDSSNKGKTLVYDKLTNLPESYENKGLNMSGLQIYGNNTDINTDGAGAYLELWRSLDNSNTYGARKNPERNIDYKCMIQKLNKLYNGVPMTDNSVYKQIVDIMAKTDEEKAKKGREIYCGYLHGCKSEIEGDNSQSDVTCP